MKARPKLTRLLLRILLYGFLVLVIACGLFLKRGQQRLIDLITHSSQKATEVYSTWLDLLPSDTLTADYIRGTLDVLGYESVPQARKPGQYALDASRLEVWTRGFEFPDQTFAPQLLRLSFWNGHLSKLETLPDGKNVDFWRLEPKRLARWALQSNASQPKVRMETLPAYVPMAVVAIEDKRFFQHGAVDLRGLLRAIWVDVRQGELRQGGSTITQQLSRSIFLDIQRTWTRKILEAGLAVFLEVVYSKPQLLEMYLNQVYWGHDGIDTMIGLESASRSFFGKAAKDLTLAESAMLAGLLQSPNRYSPRSDLTRAKQRRNLVLSLMRAQEHITEQELKMASLEPIRLAPLPPRAGQAPYFVSSLQDMLLQRYSFGTLMSEGWRIYTTLDPLLQTHAVNALKPSEGQAALLALDPKSGAVRAWVGGTGYAKSTYDRVIYARRQPGSAFKPFVMLAAIDNKTANQTTLLEDKPFKIETPMGPWSPLNYDKKYRGTVSLRDALVLSLNVPTVHLAMQTGLEKIVELAQRMGIKSPLRAVPSLALGTSEVSVLELTSAYATLANQGTYLEPYTVEQIVDANRQEIERHVPQPQFVVSALSAFIVTQMLQSVLETGTGQYAKTLGFTHLAAGKTGTSENYQDAWFVGYSPRLVCGVWVGHDQPHSLGRSAAGIALPLWVSFMQRSLSLWPEEKWPDPKGLVWKTIDPESGAVARSGCRNRRKDAFLPGTEPNQMCKLHPGGLAGFFYRWRNK